MKGNSALTRSALEVRFNSSVGAARHDETAHAA
jgi:hypothetical protein